MDDDEVCKDEVYKDEVYDDEVYDDEVYDDEVCGTRQVESLCNYRPQSLGHHLSFSCPNYFAPSPQTALSPFSTLSSQLDCPSSPGR